MLIERVQRAEKILKKLVLLPAIACLLPLGGLSRICHAQSAPASASAGATVSSREPLTVMTWNLEWFYDDYAGDNYSKLAKEKSAPSRSQWDWRRDAIAASIHKARPTVLAVQEVENRRVLWYLTRALARNHRQEYHEICFEGRDHFTEQDVGLLIRPPIDLQSATQAAYPKRMRSTNRYLDVTKHIIADLDFPVGDNSYERVIVMTVHLRATREAQSLRIRQARLVHHWIAESIRSGENVVLLGDFNTEETGDATRKESDIGIASGLETQHHDDDLVDLNRKLVDGNRQTHLLDGRQYDRILCSPSLLRDDPSKPDLVFSKIEVRRDLAIRGTQDTPEEHWDNYWNLSQQERDLSDHYPVMATFEVR
jgi:endonuclease/exonuclease/phosphatase family metal-dependent hydrolase